MDKMTHFCNHIRAAMACYVDMTPEQQVRARFYASRKMDTITSLKDVSMLPGGELAADLLQKMQQAKD